MIGRLLPTLVSVAVVVLVAGLTHLTAILLLPRVATRDAYLLLASYRGHEGMQLFPPSRPKDDLIPFRDPLTVQGLCFFDLKAGPFRIKTKTEEGRLLTLSFRTPEGKIFYSMSDRAALRENIDIRLVTGRQLTALSDQDDEDQGLPEELRLQAPTTTGLIVATALVARPSERADAESRVKAIACRREPLPAPS